MDSKSPSHLSAAITRLLKRSYPSERALAAALDLSHSNLRQVLAGQRCSLKILSRLLAIFPEPDDYWLIVSAHLLDEAGSAGVDTQKLVVRPTDGVTLREMRLSKVYEDYLGIIARRMNDEVGLAESDRLITQQVDWLSHVIVTLEAKEADGRGEKIVPFGQVAEDVDSPAPPPVPPGISPIYPTPKPKR